LTFEDIEAASPDDLVSLPDGGGYFGLNEDLSGFEVYANDGVETSLQFMVGLPSRFTLQLVIRCPQLPHNLGDLSKRRFGVTVADDAGRGFTMYFAKTGVAISRVDNYGAATALPDTTDVTTAVAENFFTLRIAVDGALGRAYVFVGEGLTDTPALRWIIPVEPTPEGTGDVFKLFAKGLANEPVFVEFSQIRLAGDLVLANYPPVAHAGADRVAPIGNAVRFDGRASYEVEGAPLKYRWQCIDAPTGSTYAAEVSSATSVDDGDADGFTTIITTSPLLVPEWLAPGDVVRIGGGVYELSLVDADSGLLEVTSAAVPDDLEDVPLRLIRQSILLDAASPTPVAVPDLPGLYRFRLVVNDGEADSEPSEVLANVTALQTPSGVEPDVAIIWKAIGDEWHFIEGRDVFEEAWIGVAQILSGKLLEAWQHHYNTSIRDAQQVFQRKWVGYRTMLSEVAPDTVELSPRYGSFLAPFRFELGNEHIQALEGLALNIEVLEADGTYKTVTLAIPVFLSGNVRKIAAAINDALNDADIEGIEAQAWGSRDNFDNLRYQGTAHTEDNGDGNGLTNSLTTQEVLPEWAAYGDIVSFAGKRYPVEGAGDGGIFVDAQVPDDLPDHPFTLFRIARLVITGTRAFRLSGEGAVALGLPVGVLNDLEGAQGTRVTDRVYYVEGVDFAQQGVQRGDLLVLNNGESFRIDRVLSDLSDPHDNQRVLLFDRMAPDSTSTWAVPSRVVSAETDYEVQGTYPGDLAKTEIYAPLTGQVETANSYVVAQKDTQLAVRLGVAVHAALLAGKELRFTGVKRRKALPLPADVLSVPTLQELIAEKLQPLRYREHVDYILEPFYRDAGGRPLPMLQFADSVFIDPDLEPPDVLWAETTLFDNQGHVEDLFGRLVGFLRDDAASFPKDFNYVAGVAGLLYAQQRGPNLFAMSVGAQILLGQPFAEAPGYIEEIRTNYSPRQGRILVRDDDGSVPTESDTVRAYYYTKNPADLSETSGLAVNPETNALWQVGELVPQFSALGAGIELDDMYTKPKWWQAYVGSGVMYEVEKFHRFVCTFDLTLVDIANISLLFSMITRIKPTYTRLMLVGAKNTSDDIDIEDTTGQQNTLLPYDSLLGFRGYRFDDYRGNGITSCLFDDGVTRCDALVDVPLDIITFGLLIQWPGGTVTLPSTWPFVEGALLVDGIGGNFVVSNGMSLPAGTYQTNMVIKSGPILPPL
jgi:hypothetical protein